MKKTVINIALEKQLLNRRDPRHAIASARIAEYGTRSQPLSNTESLLAAIKEEGDIKDDDFLPYDYQAHKASK